MQDNDIAIQFIVRMQPLQSFIHSFSAHFECMCKPIRRKFAGSYECDCHDAAECYDSISTSIFLLTIVFFTSMLADAVRSMDVSHVLRTRLSRIPASCIMCHRLVYSYVPVPVLRVSPYLLLVLLRIVDSFPVTCSSPVPLFTLSTRTLTLLAYDFLLLTRRLVCAYRYCLCLSFCSLSTCLPSRYFWTLTRYRVVSLSCIFVLVSRILLYIRVGDVGLFPIFNLLCNHPKGVTCEIPCTLLVLSSSLAKATALRP